MPKIAILGDMDSIQGFSTLGIDLYPTSDYEKTVSMLKRIADSDYAIIYVIESTYIKLEKEIEKYKDQKLPSIICIPGVTGTTGYGMRAVSKSVERAVGSDIIFE